MAPSEDTWYVLRNETQIGPVRFNQLQELARRKVLHESDLIKGPGLQDWVTAEDVPALFPEYIFKAAASKDAIEPPPLPRAAIVPPPLPIISSMQFDAIEAQTLRPSLDDQDRSLFGKKNKRQNYFARHWRGELPLHVSYWFNGVGGYIVVTVIVTIISATAALKEEFAPTWALFSLSMVWSITFVAVGWQIVGAWNSATNYQIQKPRSYWGAAAKVSLVIAALRTVGALGYTGIPQLSEYYQIYMGDKNVGGHSFRVMRNGRELEFSGGISFGVATEFAQFLNAMGALQTVHLNSIGGRIGEAKRIANLIKTRGLDTYVAGRCLSACTIVFLSGRNRLIAPGAKIGFHQPSFPGLTADDRNRIIAAEELRLRQLGVSAAFAKRANATPPEQMWLPSPSELIAEKVATRIVDPSNFAFSGVDLASLTPARVDEFLRGIEIYAAIERISPSSYGKMKDELLLGLRQGKTMGEMRSKIAPIADRVYLDILPQASPELLVEYARLLIEHLKFLNQRSSTDCYAYANPEKIQGATTYEIATKYPLLDDKERAFRLKVMKTYRPNAFAANEAKHTDAALATVFVALKQRFGTNTNLITEDEVPPEKHFAYCTVLTAFYEEISRLPTTTGVAVLRTLLASR
ncbi:MAG: GYF domain-containing protein [Pseudolabrys sp.]